MPSLLDTLLSLFRPAKFPADSLTEPAQVTRSKVLAIVYNPVMDAAGTSLSQKMKWYDPGDLFVGFMADLLEVSHGLARYEIVQRIDVNEFPARTDGFRDTPQTYIDTINRVIPPHTPPGADYYAILKQFDILARLARNEIDEVWIMGFPYAGFYESVMAGPGAFWCNSQPLTNTSASKRRFIIMGFSYERFIGEMLESYSHRAESIMEKTFGRLSGDANLWKRFIRYEKSAPGKAACGTVHYSPNSQTDYDWGNVTLVKSECYDWLLNFPNFKGDIRTVDASEWGKGDIRAHHTWWLGHFPHVAGRKNGVHNNWWQYVVTPQQVIV